MTLLVDFIFFILVCFISTISIAGLGQLITYKTNKNFFENIFYGFIIISLLTTSFHFFFKFSILNSITIFLLGFVMAIRTIFISKTRINKNLFFYFLYFVLEILESTSSFEPTSGLYIEDTSILFTSLQNHIFVEWSTLFVESQSDNRILGDLGNWEILDASPAKCHFFFRIYYTKHMYQHKQKLI